MATFVASANARVLDDKYEIIQEIKQGGFGIVYHGIDRKLNKRVAIKEIAPSLVEDPKYLDMFQEEALNIAKLNHNNIVHVYEFTKASDGRLYIIMEHIDGTDLEKIIRFARKRRQAIPPTLALFIAAEVCLALDYAHNRRDAFTNKPLKLVHQDISPSNIMISRTGQVKLIDFGIASVKRHRSDAKKDKKVRGKIPYMTPEQIIRGNHPDHRSDLFSLGLVLYETLTLQRLFRTQEELVAAGKNPKGLSRVIQEKKLHPALEKILAQALAVDLAGRYQSANHMYIDLMQHLISTTYPSELPEHLAGFLTGMLSGNTSQSWTDATHSGSTGSPFQTSGSPHRSAEPSPQGWQPAMASRNGATPNGKNGTNGKDLYHQKESQNRGWAKIKSLFNGTIEPTSELEFDEEEEDLKTVIDIIRVSARNNQKRLFLASLAVIVGLLAFGVLDTINGWSSIGRSIYDALFPPAIEIVTTPPNAKILLDGREISSRAPAHIGEVSPGVHKLELKLDGYKPIIKSLFVPREGSIRVEGESSVHDSRTYLFRFNTEIELTSNPPGAHVILNGIRYNQKTPCMISWEVGTPLSIELEQPGFERLSGFTLDTLEGIDIVEDRRYWDMQVTSEEVKRYSVHGLFRKAVHFQTVPSEVEIFDYQSSRVIGVTGKNKRISIPAGTHEFELRQDGFIPQKMVVHVGPNSENQVKAVLNRRVKVLAFDKRSSNQSGLKVTLVSLKKGTRDILRRKRTTPFEMTLPAYSYTAIFQKPGYQKREVRISPSDHLVRVEMEPLDTDVAITLIDAKSKQPIAEAEIHYNYSTKPLSIDRFFDVSDGSGKCSGKLPVGDYVLRVRKRGYQSLRRTLIIRPDTAKTLVLELHPMTN